MAINVGTAVAYLDLNMTAFNSGLQQAQSALQTFQNSASSIGQNMMAAGGMITNIGSGLTRNITMPLVSAGQEVVQFGATFDKQMSAVEAVMKSKLKEGDLERLREAAMSWGEQTVYTATEAAEALYYMGLAGWDVDQAISGLGNVLNLAAAGQMDLGRASDVVTDSMTAMNLVAGQTTDGIENTAYYTSVLAAVMANSNTDIDKLGESFKYVAPVAGNLGYTIEDLGLALGLAANAGIKSSQAGTSLRQALKNLITPTDRTKIAMEEYGISLFDANGQAIPFRDIMIQLQQTFGDLGVEVFDANGELKDGEEVMREYGESLPITQQEKLAAVVDLFGTRAMPTMLAIIQQGGTEFDKLAEAIDEAARTGSYAAEMAHTQMDNLQGAWTRFTSALGTTKIMLNDLVSDELRRFVERLTEIVKWFNSLDDAQKENVIKWGLIAAAVGPVLMLFGNLLRSIGLIVEGFTAIKGVLVPLQAIVKAVNGGWEGMAMLIGGEGSGGLIGTIAKLGAKFNWIIAIIALVVAAIVDLWRNNEEFRENITRIWNAIVSVIQSVWDLLKPIFDAMMEIFKAIVKAIEPLVALLVEILAPIIEVICQIIKSIFEAIKPLIQIITDAVVPVINFLAQVIKSLVDIIKPAIQFIAIIIQALLDVIKLVMDGIGLLVKTAVKSWLDSFNDFFNRAKQGWEMLTNWLKNSWLGKLFDKIGTAFKDTIAQLSDITSDSDYNPFIGSHRDGLSYVPYDGYVAELHKGERVLTAEENARYSSTSGGNGTTINFYSNERIDEYTAAKELRRTMKDMELGLV